VSIWDEVEKLVQEGQQPRITLAPQAEVRPPKKAPHRPRFRDPENPFAHYKTPKLGYSRPRCLICKTPLKVSDVEVCRDLCREKAIAYFSMKLASLTGRRVSVEITPAAAKYLRDAGIVEGAA